jgi:regulator of sigma E protease
VWWFLVTLGVLVTFHEFGHFWVARRFGVRVLKFSVGFGKPLWSRVSKKDGVEYVIGSIPLGGYVKMLDEREGDVAPEDAPFSYNRAAPWKRILTLLAGPLANLLFAVLVYWILLMVGVPGFKPVVGDVTPDSIAARAGLQSDDLIVEVQNHEVSTIESVLMGLVDSVSDEAVKLQVRADMGHGASREVVLQTGEKSRELSEPQTMMSGLGFDFWRPSVPAVIGTIVSGGPAEQAGLKVGDRITVIDSHPVKDFNALVELVKPRKNQQVMFGIQRGDEVLNLPVKIGEKVVDGPDKSIREGIIGIGNEPTKIVIPDEMHALQKFGPVTALSRAAQQTWETSVMTLKLVGKMIVGEVSTKNLSGVVSTFQYSGAAARQGIVTFAGFLAIISISIGIFNLLPIPMLDGGQILYQLVELLKGSPVSERIQLISQQIGVAMLLMLLSLTIYNDIARNLS